MADSRPLALRTGSAPGRPRHTGHTCVFGAAPKTVEHPQNIFVAVLCSTCTSNPMTGSKAVRASSKGSRVSPVALVRTPGSGGVIRVTSTVGQSRRAVQERSPPHRGLQGTFESRTHGGRAGRRRGGATIWNPTGSPSSAARPAGSDIPGSPARFTGMVVTSLRYMASGSSIFSPRRKAVVGAVGDTTTSASRKAAAKSLCDERADLLGRAVVGVVVAGRQGVGPQDDPPLDLRTEPDGLAWPP